MNDKLQSRGVEEVQTFLDKVYWITGTFLFVWSLAALNAIYRRRVLDLPVFGETQISETIIFTQCAFCLLVPFLLFTVSVYRGYARSHGLRSRSPGVPADKLSIPKPFHYLRPVIYIGLVCFPVMTMIVCYQRTIGTLRIEAHGHPSCQLVREQMFEFSPKYAGIPAGEKPDWRWRGEEDNVAKVSSPAEISALPFYEPWLFRLVSYASATVALWFLLSPPGTMRRRLGLLK